MGQRLTIQVSGGEVHDPGDAGDERFLSALADRVSSFIGDPRDDTPPGPRAA